MVAETGQTPCGTITERWARSTINILHPSPLSNPEKHIPHQLRTVCEHYFRFSTRKNLLDELPINTHIHSCRGVPGPSPELERGAFVSVYSADAMVGSPPAVLRPTPDVTVRSCQKCVGASRSRALMALRGLLCWGGRGGVGDCGEMSDQIQVFHACMSHAG